MAWVIQNGCGTEPLPVSFVEQEQQPGLNGTRADTFREIKATFSEYVIHLLPPNYDIPQGIREGLSGL